MVMDASLPSTLVLWMFLSGYCLLSVEAVAKICQVTSDCGLQERCCDEVCLERRDCEGTCSHDTDCDERYGEKCIKGLCECVDAPCESAEGKPPACETNSKCPANMTCVNGVCRYSESKSLPTRDPNFSPAVLAVVATVGLLLFVGAFYFCLRKQQTTRPSLAAKEAHIRATERSRSSEHRVSTDDSWSQEGSCQRSSENSRLCEMSQGSSAGPPGNIHIVKQEGAHKRSSLVGSMDLSAIIEEDEVSEAMSK